MASSHDNTCIISPARRPFAAFNHRPPRDPPRDPSKRAYGEEGHSGDFTAKSGTGAASLFTHSAVEFSECSRCEMARVAGLDTWMNHLGEEHTFPLRWPSSKFDDGFKEDGHPYTSVVDSHKKRRGAGVPRPLNSFMIFAQYIRRLTLSTFPDAPNVHISQQVGRLWRNLSDDVREVYAKEARRLQILHSLEFPDYKYQPRRRIQPLECEESDSHGLAPRSVIKPPLPPLPPLPSTGSNPEQYVKEVYCHLKPSPSSDVDSITELEFANSILDSSLLCAESNTDTLTSLQGAENHTDMMKVQSESDSMYPPALQYSTHIDDASHRLGWMEDKITEPLVSSSQQLQPLSPSSSLSQSSDFLQFNEQWFQCHKESSFGEVLPLPSIETWTFSGSAT